MTIEVEGRRKKASEAFVEIAQQLWRHPIEHTDDSPQIPPYPLGRMRKMEVISKSRIAQKVVATRGAKKRNVATKGTPTPARAGHRGWKLRRRLCPRRRTKYMCSNYSTLVATKGAEKQKALKLSSGCGDGKGGKTRNDTQTARRLWGRRTAENKEGTLKLRSGCGDGEGRKKKK